MTIATLRRVGTICIFFLILGGLVFLPTHVVQAATARGPGNLRAAPGSTGHAGPQPNGTQTICSYAISPESFSVPASGATGLNIAVSTSTGCTWMAAADASWITIVSGVNGFGSGTVTFDVAANSGAARTGLITVAGDTVAVTQAAGEATPAFTYSPQTPVVCQAVIFTAPAGVTVKSWAFGSADCNSSPPNTFGDTYCSAIPGACHSVVWSFPAAGTFTVTMTPTSGEPVSQQVVVKPPTTCSFHLTTPQMSFDAAGGSGSIDTGIDGSCQWTAMSETPSWLHLGGSSVSGSGNGPIQFTVDANTGQDPRTGEIVITGVGTTASATVMITQAGAGSTDVGGSFSPNPLVSVAANAAGKNGTDWKTELCVYNPNSAQATFDIKLLPNMSNNNGGTVVPVNGQDSQTVAGFGTWCNDDVLAGMGNRAEGALAIELEHPDQYPLGLAATSRTYTSNPNGAGGTYGQFVPALTASGAAVRQLVLTGLHAWGDEASGEGYRTNIGFVNQSAQLVPRIYIKVYDASGQLVGQYQNKASGDPFLSLGAHGFVQYDTILRTLDHPVNELRDFSIVITFSNVAGHPTAEPVSAYATVVDNATGDATFLMAQSQISGGHESSLVPVVAHSPGRNGTDWKTELCVSNPNPETATFSMKLLSQVSNDDGGVVVQVNGHATETVPSLGTWCSEDVLAGAGQQTKGALVVALQNAGGFPFGLFTTSRTYTPNPDGAGTYGQFVPALPFDKAPVHQLVLTGLHAWGDASAGEGFRTNIGLVNETSDSVSQICIKVYDASGNLVGQYQDKASGNLFTSLGAYGFVQLNQILSKLDHPVNELHDFTIVISFNDDSGNAVTASVVAYATIVDNATGDGTFVPAIRMP